MNHYEILDLAEYISSSSPLDETKLKRAYREALLKHHPDKSRPSKVSAPSVDAIKLAYTILSDPSSRSEYDKQLLTRRPSETKAEERFRTGEEIVDLDDLTYDTKNEKWFRSCRCGEDHGFVLTERQLELADMDGNTEILVDCIGCSLWLRVAFSIAPDEEQAS